jgi:hypothetical protein
MCTQGAPTGPTSLVDPVRFTAFEIQRLLALVWPLPPREERIRRGLAWSLWRRLHQAVARACHRRRRAATRPTGHPLPHRPDAELQRAC